MKRALFPGTFDPPTLGHLDIIQRALDICDELYIGVATNIGKGREALFSTEEKMQMLQDITRSLPQVKVASFSGLVVTFAKKHNINFLIRGLRAFSDFEFEFRMALANRKISGIETVFLMADERHAHISSTLIRELGHYETRLNDFVPAAIEDKVFKRLLKS